MTKSILAALIIHEANRKCTELIKKVQLPKLTETTDADKWVALEIGEVVVQKCDPHLVIEDLTPQYKNFQTFLLENIKSLPEDARLAIDNELEAFWTGVEQTIAQNCLSLPEQAEAPYWGGEW